MICAAHSLTAMGRAADEFNSVHRPSTQSFLSWRLNIHNNSIGFNYHLELTTAN